jgi:hypothetical protein
VRVALLHQHRVRGDGGEGVEAQVARADGVVVEEVRAERGAEDLVGALDVGPVVGRVLPVGLFVERGHVRLQPLERRLLAARELLRLLALRPQPELPVRHRRLQKVEARREPVRAVLPLQHHHRERRERQARHHHARERVQLVLRAQGGQRIHRKDIRVQQVLQHFRRQRRVLAVLDIHLRAIFTAARETLGLHAHICNESRSFKHYIFFSGMLERLFIVSVFTQVTFMSRIHSKAFKYPWKAFEDTERGQKMIRNHPTQTDWDEAEKAYNEAHLKNPVWKRKMKKMYDELTVVDSDRYARQLGLEPAEEGTDDDDDDYEECTRTLKDLLEFIKEKRHELKEDQYEKTVEWSDLSDKTRRWFYPSIESSIEQQTKLATAVRNFITKEHTIQQIQDHIIKMTQEHILTLSNTDQALWFRYTSVKSEPDAATIQNQIEKWSRTRLMQSTKAVALKNYSCLDDMVEDYFWYTDEHEYRFHRLTVFSENEIINDNSLYDAVAEQVDMNSEELRQNVSQALASNTQPLYGNHPTESKIALIIKRRVMVLRMKNAERGNRELMLFRENRPQSDHMSVASVYLLQSTKDNYTHYDSLTLQSVKEMQEDKKQSNEDHPDVAVKEIQEDKKKSNEDHPDVAVKEIQEDKQQSNEDPPDEKPQSAVPHPENTDEDNTKSGTEDEDEGDEDQFEEKPLQDINLDKLGKNEYNLEILIRKKVRYRFKKYNYCELLEEDVIDFIINNYHGLKLMPNTQTSE